MSARKPHRSPLAVVLLALLAEAPAHPYRMQQLIRERRKDKIVNVHRRGSIYQTIDRLLRDELIAVRDVARERGRPERTVYEISQPGRVALRAWLSEMLAAPAAEFPEFPAALAFLPVLEPAEVQAAMAFGSDYQVLGNKRERVRQLGNAVTPPAMRLLVQRVAAGLS